MTLHVVCWKWSHPTYRTRFAAKHVNVLAAMFRRHYDGDCRIVCVTDDPTDVECDTHPLWNDCSKLINPNGPHFPSCFRRLKLFDPDTLRALKIHSGERVLSIDLDVVITKNVTALFDRDEDFVGWRGVGAYQPVVYNGSLFMHRADSMAWLWKEFDPLKSPAAARRARYFGSDQGYLSHRLNGSVPGWDRPEVLSYSRDMCRSTKLPSSALIVSFNGKSKPWDPSVQAEAPWIRDHWRS